MLTGWADGLKSVGKQWALAGSAGVGAFLGAAKVFADTGSQLDDMSQRTGASVEALSALKYAAEQSGTSLEAIETGVKKLSVNLAEATSGSKSAREKFDKLGLSWSDLAKMSPEDQFVAIAERLSQITDPGQKAAATIDILGKSGAELIPLMNGGAKGVAALVDEAKRLGLVMTSAEATAAAEFGDKLDRAWAIASRSVGRVGAAVVGALGPFLDMLIPLAAATGQWIENNRGVFQIILAVSAAVAAAGAVMWSLGTAIAATITVVSTAAAVLGAILSPIGLVTVAVTGLAAYLITLSDGFGKLASDTMRALNLMGRALASGDLSLAADVLWSYLKLQWTRGKAALTEIWISTVEAFVDAWRSAVFAVAKFGIESWAGLRIAWSETVNFIANAASAVTTGWVVAWQWAIGLVEKAWIGIRALFGEKIDVRMAMRGVDAKTQGVIDQAHAMHNQAAGARNSEAGRRRDQIMTDARSMTDSLAAQRQAERNKRASENEKALADAAKSLEEASAKWDAAAAKAESATAGVIEAAVAGAQGASAGTSNAVSMVSGTFNPMNFRGLGGGSQTDPVVNKIEELRKEVAAMRKDERERPKL